MDNKIPNIPETKTETMEDYREEIEKSLVKANVGDIVSGKVVAVSDEEVILDMGIYASGTVKKEEYSADPKFDIHSVQIGDEVSATVKRLDDGKGNLLLSVKDAADELAWDKLADIMNEKKAIDVKISSVVKSGVVCYPEGVRGFIPASKLALSFVYENELPSYIGKTLKVQVISCDKKEKKLVLSAKEILKEQADRERVGKASNFKVGMITQGKVESVTDFGAFVDMGEGLSGLVHISKISQKRIKHPSEALKVGDEVKVKVVSVKDGKISLSMKDLEDMEAETLSEEVVNFKGDGNIGTSLADLLKKAGF